MSTLTTNYLDIIERLPAGAKLELFHIDWGEYEQLLSQMGDFPGHRLSYERGRLIIVSPRRGHEFFKVFIGKMSQVLAEELGLAVEATGATALRRKNLGKGVEPAESFYVRNAASVVGRLEFDLDVDPPPDVAIEIDMTNASPDKFPVYAAPGVPESGVTMERPRTSTSSSVRATKRYGTASPSQSSRRKTSRDARGRVRSKGRRPH